MSEESFEPLRRKMVEEQIMARGIIEPRIIRVLSTVPRHLFVLEEDWNYAYSDFPLPIGYGQTISQPYIVALMTEMLDVQSSHKVLEIGTGSGYQAAILGCLAREIHTVEIIEELGKVTMKLLEKLDYSNIHVHIGDGSSGWVENAPYDRIMVTAAAPSVPTQLLSQLALDGQMVIPIGDRAIQHLEKWKRIKKGYEHERDLSVCFVPLRGKYGWR